MAKDGHAREVGGGRVYLVVEADVLIARDLYEILTERDDGAEVHLARGGAEAAAIAGALPRLSAAFVGLPGSEVAASGLADAVWARGGALVTLDGAARAIRFGPGPGRVTVPRPYTDRDVARVLERLSLD